MKRYLIIAYLLFTGMVATQAKTEERISWEQSLQQILDSLITDDLFQTTQLGMMVWDLTADSVLYAHHHMHRMRPASTMKLLTAITALDQFGSSHNFKTELYYRGQIDSRTLRGDLLCVGGMDPAFDNADMRVFVDRVRTAGIDSICGHIIGDKSMKDQLLLGEGWCWDDDNPILSPLLVSRKDNFTEQLRKELLSAGIVIADSISDPLSSQHLIATCTHPMGQILKRMMKQSDNLYAESMFYHVATATGYPATVKNARSNVRRLIQKLGYNPASYYIADGSGLSLYNYVTPELLISFLRYAYQNNSIYANLLPTLPVAGVDGTLKDRMKNTPAFQNVKAKTGTLTGISSLAGYCTGGNGHQLAFVIINQGIQSAKSGKTFQDKVCAALCTPLSDEL